MTLPEKSFKLYSEGYLVEWWMIHLFSCESHSLELNFCYPSLNLGCVFSWEKAQPPYWRFLAFYPYPRETIQYPILGISYILLISLGEYTTSCIGGFLYFTQVLPLPQESALCPRQVPVTPTQPPRCPDHQSGTQLSYHGPCTELTWSFKVLAWTGPFLTYDLDFIIGHRDSGSPQP
jgi:hypothetical protein